MAAFTTVLAFDLGASTGRAIRAVYDGERLQWKEIHRFDNIPAVENGHLRWNMEALLGEIRIAIQKAGKTDSLAFDTWGVDFGLLDADGKLLEDPRRLQGQQNARQDQHHHGCRPPAPPAVAR